MRFCSQYFRLPATEKPSHWPCLVAGWQALLRRHFRHEGGVKLQLAIDYQPRRALTDDFCRLLDVGNAGVTGAAVTGKRQHRHARLFSGDGACRFRRWQARYPPVVPPSAVAPRCNRQNPTPDRCTVAASGKMEESVLQPGCKPIMRNPARSTFAVEERLPAIQTSAVPALTIAAANISGSVSFSNASGGVFFARTGQPAIGAKFFPHCEVAMRISSPVARPLPRRD